MRINVPLMLKDARRVPYQYAACPAKAGRPADIFYGTAVARIYLCCRTEPYVNLLWIRDGLPYFFGKVGESPLVLKGCIAAFDRYCSNSVVHVRG